MGIVERIAKAVLMIDFDEFYKDLLKANEERIKEEHVVHNPQSVFIKAGHLREILYRVNKDVQVSMRPDFLYQFFINTGICIPGFVPLKTTLINKYKLDKKKADELMRGVVRT